ncbi:tRNA threonylcarbamoyladenosine dehydratase [Neisseriaceae bacterium PsAf]|nr:tRNA threonylcarbamoyladenosine dehydratase [Neisseriaceae bacterium PsAf]
MQVSRKFFGISRLYGEENFYKINQSHICVIGLGGVGSWVVEALVRSGVGQLTIIDLDNVSESNINRQLPALSSNFGKPKVEAIQERMLEINPEIKITPIEDFVDEGNYLELFSSPFSFVVEAIDQVKIKTLLANHFIKNKQPFVVSGGAGGKQSAQFIQTSDLSEVTHDKLLANMRYQLRKNFNFPKKGKMKINCVFSKEPSAFPVQNCESDVPVQSGLSCAGYGSSMLVTTSFAMQLADSALKWVMR